MSALETKDLQVSIGSKTVCQSLSLIVDDRQIWAILGCNGIGKTTLLHTLAGLRSADNGTIQLLNKPMLSMQRKEIARSLGILFQQQVEPFPATVLETALIGRHPFLRTWQWETQEDIAIAERALADVELGDLSHRSIYSLSGGERQRLKVATLLTQNPKVMLLDEPTNHLDPHHQIRILQLLTRSVKDSGGAMVMVLHDINLAVRFCSHILLMGETGEIQAGVVDEIMHSEFLSKAYGWPITGHKTASGVYFAPE